MPFKANGVLGIRLQPLSASCSSNPPTISTPLQELSRLKLQFFSALGVHFQSTDLLVCMFALEGNIHMCFFVFT